MIVTFGLCIAAIGFTAQSIGTSIRNAQITAVTFGAIMLALQAIIYVWPEEIPKLQHGRSRRALGRYAFTLLASGLIATLASISAPAVQAAILNRRLKQALLSSTPPDQKAQITGRIMADAVKTETKVQQSLVSEAELKVLLPLLKNASPSAVFALGQTLAYWVSLLEKGELVTDSGNLYSQAHAAMEILPLFYPLKPLGKKSKIYGAADLYDDKFIGGASISSIHFANNLGGLPAPPLGIYIVALADRYAVTLDGLSIQNIVFKDSIIVYHGGPVAIRNISFVNCVFEFSGSASDALRHLALSGDLVNFQNP